MLLESYLTGIAGSLSADWLGQAGTWVRSRSPVAKAVDDTARRYGSTERRRVRDALEQWVESGAFTTLLSELRAGTREGIEERFRASFQDRGGYREVDPDGTRTDRVLHRFVQHLRARLLEAGRLDLLDVHIEKVGARLKHGQDRLHEDHLEIRNDLEEIKQRLDRGPRPLTLDDLDAAERRFAVASETLLSWPRTTGGTWIERPELGELLQRVSSEATSVSLIEGPRGTGKSALLAEIGMRLKAAEVTVVAVKADVLPLSLLDADDVVADVPGGTVQAVRELATRQPVVVLLDQLDALSDVSDVHPGRLNAVLDLVSRLRGIPGVSVVASVRPFERSVDTRLQTAFREVIALAPPAWDDVEPLLASAGHDPSRAGAELRELLRIPEFLRVYLRVARPNQAYASWHALYEDYWASTVLQIAPDAPSLVGALVSWMSDEEALWAPSSLTDSYADASRALQRADVVVHEGGRVGFRHQGLFEFARARAFASGAESLVEHVRDREDGLFVRPVLVAGLTSLREMSPRRYGEAIASFLGGSFRPHVEQLVGEYVAAQNEPIAAEVSVLLPRLDEALGRQTLVPMRQSPGWFRTLAETGTLADLMSRPPDEALAVLGVLVAASKRGDGETVFELVQQHWLSDPAYDELSLSALDEMPAWPAEVTRAMMAVAHRFPRTFRHHIAMLGLKGDAATGFDALRDALDRETAEAFTASGDQGRPTEADDQVSDLAARLYRQQARRAVLREWHQWPAIAEYVGQAPGAFVRSLWPWFEAALLDEPATQDEGFRYRRPMIDSGWDDDERERDQTVLGIVTRFLVALGEADEGAFMDIVDRLGADDRMRPHRAVAQAYAALAERYMERAVDYLLGDPRRLILSTFGSAVGETVALLRALSPHVGEPQRARLERAIRTFGPARPDGEEEDRWAEVTERARLRLMRGMECPSEAFEAEREEAEEAHPDLPDETRIVTGFSAVLPPVPGSALADMSAEAWLDVIRRVLAGEAADLAAEHHEESVSPFHLGSADVQAGAFEEAAKASPDVAWEVITRLSRPSEEPFTTALIGGIGASDADGATEWRRELPSRVLAFNRAGFTSDSFRYRASDALARVSGGLGDDVFAMLESWFWDEEVTDVPTSGPHLDRERSLLFDNQYGGFGGGKVHMLRALAAGCLYRERPAFDRWVSLVHRIADAEPHEMTAAWAIRLSGHLFLPSNPDREAATEAVAALVRSAPGAMEREEGLIGLARLLRHMSPQATALDLIDFVRTLAWEGSEQAFGEMAVALHVGTHGDESAARIRGCIAEGSAALRGAAFGASALWIQSRSARPLMFAVLREAVSSEDDVAAGAARRAFLSFAWGETPRDWVPEDEALVRAVAASDAALKASVEGVLAACARRVRENPDLASDVASAVVSAIERRVFDRWETARLDEPLIQVALTLHRQPAHRESGLVLFEAVYRLGLRAAREAIQTLDRSPYRT